MGKSKRSKKKKQTSPEASAGGQSAEAQETGPGGGKKKRTLDRDRQVSPELLTQQQREEKRRRWVNRSLIGVAATVVVGLLVYAVWSIIDLSGLPDPNEKPKGNYSIPTDATKSGVTMGDENAPQTMDIYLDYNCGACKLFEEQMQDIIDEKIQDESLVVTYHPVGRLNPYSVLAGGAAGCARDEGKFIEYSKKLFNEQGEEEFDDDRLKKIGKDIGLDSGEFQQCVEDRTYVDWVLGINQEFKKAGYNGTPTVLVDDDEIKTDNMVEMISKTRKELGVE